MKDLDYKSQLTNNMENPGIMLVKGVSMEPILFDGDIIFIEKQSDYYVGDIIVFHYLDEGIIVHRITSINHSAIICKGDNSKRQEIILKRQIIGKVVDKVRIMV